MSMQRLMALSTVCGSMSCELRNSLSVRSRQGWDREGRERVVYVLPETNRGDGDRRELGRLLAGAGAVAACHCPAGEGVRIRANQVVTGGNRARSTLGGCRRSTCGLYHGRDMDTFSAETLMILGTGVAVVAMPSLPVPPVYSTLPQQLPGENDGEASETEVAISGEWRNFAERPSDRKPLFEGLRGARLDAHCAPFGRPQDRPVLYSGSAATPCRRQTESPRPSLGMRG